MESRAELLLQTLLNRLDEIEGQLRAQGQAAVPPAIGAKLITLSRMVAGMAAAAPADLREEYRKVAQGLQLASVGKKNPMWESIAAAAADALAELAEAEADLARRQAPKAESKPGKPNVVALRPPGDGLWSHSPAPNTPRAARLEAGGPCGVGCPWV